MVTIPLTKQHDRRHPINKNLNIDKLNREKYAIYLNEEMKQFTLKYVKYLGVWNDGL